jgi:hypothetical protein
MLLSMVQGLRSEAKVERGIFPELWRQFQGRRDTFVPLARLCAVFWLKASHTCEHILVSSRARRIPAVRVVRDTT